MQNYLRKSYRSDSILTGPNSIAIKSGFYVGWTNETRTNGFQSTQSILDCSSLCNVYDLLLCYYTFYTCVLLENEVEGITIYILLLSIFGLATEILLGEEVVVEDILAAYQAVDQIQVAAGDYLRARPSIMF